jgi:hypothetical protein
MNQYCETFIDYDEDGVKLDKMEDHEFSLTSPNSDSTGLFPSTHSPNYQNYYQQTDQPPLDYLSYENEFLMQQQHPYQNVYREDGTEVSTGFHPGSEEKVLNKSKRISKRNEAKERTKARQDAASFFQGVDSKFLPEGYDDPNLDEKTRKKMIQMVRNRISAQNSRDRKKMFMNQLEDVNAKLREEISSLNNDKAILMNQVGRLQEDQNRLLHENEALKQNQICPSCRRLQNGEIGQNEDEIFQPSTEESLQGGGLSTLSSPILSRFSSNTRGFFGFAFTLATIMGIAILVMNGQPKGEFILKGAQNVKETRLLEVKNEVCRGSVYLDPRETPISKSLILQNMEPFQENFNISYEAEFKSHLQRAMMLEKAHDEGSLMQFDDLETENGIVDYNYFKASNLRRKNPTIMAKTLTLSNHISADNSQTSTLFCPSGYELFNSEHNDLKDRGLRKRTLDLEKADYIQLFVPSKMARYNIRNSTEDLHDLPLLTEEGDENSMLEIWCKVFLIRELTSTI